MQSSFKSLFHFRFCSLLIGWNDSNIKSKYESYVYKYLRFEFIIYQVTSQSNISQVQVSINFPIHQVRLESKSIFVSKMYLSSCHPVHKLGSWCQSYLSSWHRSCILKTWPSPIMLLEAQLRLCQSCLWCCKSGLRLLSLSSAHRSAVHVSSHCLLV